MDLTPDQTPVNARDAALAKFAELAFGREEQLRETLERFEVIAKIVGHDFGLGVSYGMPFAGYFFTPFPPHVVLDPARILLDPNEGEFAVEHEGAHRYNTYSLLHPDFESILGSMFPIHQLAQSVGFNAVFNGIEDPTINRWLSIVYPGSQEKMGEVYDRQFIGEDAKLYTPEVQLCEMLLGFYPKFGQFLSATIRKWHTGSWGKVDDAQVLKALEDTSEAVQRIIPLTVERTGAPENERKFACLKRYVHYISSVWPVVKKLVADDIEEAGYQAFRQSVQNSPGLPGQKGESQSEGGESQDPQQADGSPNSQPGDGHEDPQQGASQAGKSPDENEGQEQPSQGEGQNQTEDGTNESKGTGGSGQEEASGQPSPGEGSSPGSPSESQPQPGSSSGAIDDLINSLPDSLKDELRELLKTLKGAKDSPPQSGTGEGKGKSDGAKGSEKGPGEGAPGEGKPAPGTGKPSALPGLGDPSTESAPGSEESAPGADGQGRPNQSKPLSPEEDRALRDFYRRIFPRQRGGFEERGLFNLKEFEDAINRHLRSKLDPFKTPTHQEAAAREEALRQASQRQASDFKAAKDLEIYRQSLLSSWEKSLELGGGDLVRLVNGLRRILKPVSPERSGGFRSGIGLSLPHLMQDQARQVPTHRIFEQISLPETRDYFFQILADRSDSMKKDQKNSHNLTGVVLASEAFQRLNTPFELATFDTSFLMLKDRTTRFTKEEKDKAARAILHCKGGTADYAAIDKMRERAHASAARYKVMFVTSDGQSNREELLLSAIRKCGEEGIIVIGIGIGEDTAEVSINYPNGRGLLTTGSFEDPNSFVNYFLTTIKDIVTDPGRFRLFNS